MMYSLHLSYVVKLIEFLLHAEFYNFFSFYQITEIHLSFTSKRPRNNQILDIKRHPGLFDQIQQKHVEKEVLLKFKNNIEKFEMVANPTINYQNNSASKDLVLLKV